MWNKHNNTNKDPTIQGTLENFGESTTQSLRGSLVVSTGVASPRDLAGSTFFFM